MAEAKKALVINKLILSDTASVITCSTIIDATGQSPNPPLGFRGGQYIIIDTGLKLSDGRAAKRAYSMISSDKYQHEFRLAARRIGQGVGSNYLNDLNVGDIITFSGPWGRLSQDPETPVQIGPTAIMAFGTGITGALGLLNSQKFRNATSEVNLLWVDTGAFVSDSYVRASIELLDLERGNPPAVSVIKGPMDLDFDPQKTAPSHNAEPHDAKPHDGAMPNLAGHPQVQEFLGAFQRWFLEQNYQNTYLLGDGRLIQLVLPILTKAGLDGSQIKTEYYHHRPTPSLAQSLTQSLTGSLAHQTKAFVGAPVT